MSVRDKFGASLYDGTAHNQVRWYFELLDDKENGNTRKVYYYETRKFSAL